MRRTLTGRPAVIATCIVAALLVASLAVPAFGGPSTFTIAKRALTKAKQADKRSKAARRIAREARLSARTAGPRGPEGIQGPAGAQGAQGPKGDTGASPGPPAVTVRIGMPAIPGANGKGPGCVDGVPGNSKGYQDASGVLVGGGCGGGAGGAAFSTAQCEAGEVATGGGHRFEAGKRHAVVTESIPAPSGAGDTPTGWRILVQTTTNDSSNTSPVTPYVVCMRSP